MTYGQYKGQDIADVPEAYLRWLYDSAQETIDNVRAELARRESEELPDLSTVDTMDEAELREALKTAHRQLKRNGMG